MSISALAPIPRSTRRTGAGRGVAAPAALVGLPVLPGAGFGRMSAADYLVAAKAGALPVRQSGKSRNSVTSGKKRASPEEDLQRMVFDWIFANEHHYPVLKFVMHVPNGGARSKGEAGKLKAMGVRKGVVDILGPFPCPGGGLGFACELKAPGGKPTPDQSEFLEIAKSHNWVHGLCYSFDEFLALISVYLGIQLPKI